jgi:glucan phosphoethanolaminetransferase (alkaline phosphatase superfamily)
LKSPEALRENLKKQFQQEEDGDARDLLALMGSHTKERERYYRDYRYFK